MPRRESVVVDLVPIQSNHALHEALKDALDLDWATPAEFARRSGLQAAAAISEEPEVSTSERY